MSRSHDLERAGLSRRAGLPAVLAGAAVLMALWSGAARADEPAIPAADAPPAPSETTRPKKIPPPEPVVLQTADGVELHATYFPGTLGEKSIPIITLHSSKGDRREFQDLALELQKRGHAVITPDLRGFGESTRMQYGGRAVELNPATMRPADYAMMFGPDGDVEAIKDFLRKRNNERQCNIDKLCVIGSEMGAVVAIDWALIDWSWPPLATGKQGQDVKALVLISPEWGFKGVQVKEAVSHPNIRADLSVLIIAGKGNPKSLKEAKRLYSAFERFHTEPPKEQIADKKDLFFVTPNTSLQGPKLLAEKSFKVDQAILKFIEWRLEQKTIPWAERRNPLE